MDTFHAFATSLQRKVFYLNLLFSIFMILQLKSA